MEFEWDVRKSDRCLAERGFDFAYAIRAFFDPDRSVCPDDRWDYGEARFVLRGLIDDRLFVVVFTNRGGTIRIISARKANSSEV
ncbi:MAG: BrnT family toxin, partial [Spirochaetaceae bacterium]